jgi:hypothetical protein
MTKKTLALSDYLSMARTQYDMMVKAHIPLQPWEVYKKQIELQVKAMESMDGEKREEFERYMYQYRVLQLLALKEQLDLTIGYLHAKKKAGVEIAKTRRSNAKTS